MRWLFRPRSLGHVERQLRRSAERCRDQSRTLPKDHPQAAALRGMATAFTQSANLVQQYERAYRNGEVDETPAPQGTSGVGAPRGIRGRSIASNGPAEPVAKGSGHE